MGVKTCPGINLYARVFLWKIKFLVCGLYLIGTFFSDLIDCKIVISKSESIIFIEITRKYHQLLLHCSLWLFETVFMKNVFK